MNINDIEKVELHCHLDGLINHIILRQIDSRKYGKIISELEKLCPVDSFSSWIDRFYKYISPIVSNNGEFLCMLCDRYLANLQKQNVIYSEIMLTSFLFQYQNMEDQFELYKKFDQVAEKYRSTGMHVEFLIAIGRTHKRDEIEKKIERIIEIYDSGLICGIAIAGLEEENTIRPYTDIFKELKSRGIGIEIHAGEWTGPDFIWEALEYGYAQRIGHGLSMFDDRDLMEYIRNNNIHVEFCPTSNFILTGVKDIEKHPIGKALQHDIKFSINTDDPGPFCCDINNEFGLVQEAFDLGYEDFKRIKENSINASFAKMKKGDTLWH